MHDLFAPLTFASQADSFVLVSFIKPLLAMAVLVAYLRFIGIYLEKDLRYFHFNVVGWNGAFLGTACAALVAILAIPIFWIGLPVMVLILAAPLLIYWKHRNENVPEESKFHLTADTMSARSDARKARKTQREATAVFSSSKGKELTVPPPEDPLRPVHIAAEDLLLPAIEARAARVELAATPKGGTAVQVIDSVRYKRNPMAKETASAIIDYLKKAADLDTEERRKLQRGRFYVRTGQKRVVLDLSTSGSSQGLILRLDLDRDKQLDRDFEELGFVKPQVELLTEIVAKEKRHGAVLVACAPGQGLTSTLYGLLSSHDAYVTNIKTLERDVQRQIEGIDHVEFDPNKPELDFPTHIRSILRRGPDILMISDLQEPAAAEILALGGKDGPLLLVGVQTREGIAGAVTEWFRGVGDLKKAALPLNIVIAGKVMRKLCPECRQPFSPSAEQLKTLGISSGKQVQLFRASGRIQVKNKVEECPVCRGTGFFGTTGVYEVMPIDREARKQLANGDLRGAYVHARRTLRMLTMQEAALLKVRDGVTSLEEVARIFTTNQTKAAKPAPAATS